MSEDNKNVLGNEIDNLRDVLDNLQTPFSLCTLESNPRFIYVNDLMLDLEQTLQAINERNVD